MDAMWYEAYYFYSADYLNSGTGLSLISSYLTFPFLPTLITRQVPNVIFLESFWEYYMKLFQEHDQLQP